jgi:esterase/lipase superfamily enzyme
MPTPNLYANGQAPLYEDLAPELESPGIEIVYVTDRSPERGDGGELRYGFGRSPSAAFGTASIEIGNDVSWSDLVQASTTREREPRLPIKLSGLAERGRFPPTPHPLEKEAGSEVIAPDVQEEALRASQTLRELLATRLAETPRKRALVFVHGYNNSFEDAASTLAELWHFLGREGVPILYTWPAGHGGAKGYGYDRESGEFTVYHFKQFVRLLADFPEIEQIDLVAHSRGTDVTITGLRELFIESRVAGRSPREEFAIANLVLAAPDLDFQVILQRLVAERLGSGVGQATLYTSQSDKAIGAAERLFDSTTRLGRIKPEDFDDDLKRRLGESTNVDFVDYRGPADVFGHGYFHSSPAVSSDLVLVLRYDRRPGAENGRPLQPDGPHFWTMDERYPQSLASPVDEAP